MASVCPWVLWTCQRPGSRLSPHPLPAAGNGVSRMWPHLEARSHFPCYMAVGGLNTVLSLAGPCAFHWNLADEPGPL